MFAVTKVLIIVGLGLVLVLAAVSCGSKESAEDTSSADNSATAGSTSSAMLPLPPDSLVQLNSMTEAGREISMEANLWYNLMPGPEAESVPELNIQARLMTEEKSTVPGDYVLDYIWVSMGGGTWGIPPEQDQIGSGAVRERMFRGGPIYDIEDGARQEELPLATVTLRILDKAGRQFYLRKADQSVERVY